MLRSISTALCLILAASAVQTHAAESRLRSIAATKTVTIAYRADTTPFSFTQDKEIKGFSIDLCKRIVDLMGQQLKVQGLQVKWHRVTVQTRFDAVAKGQADMECGSSTVTLSRMKQVDFSSYIFVESTGLMVKSPSSLGSLADMSGKKIAVVKGTTNERAVRGQLASRRIEASVVAFPRREEAFAALEKGEVDAFASDKLLLVGAAGKGDKKDSFAILADELSFEPYGIVLPRGDADFRLAVNAALAHIYGSGEITQIFGRWFRQFGDPGPVMKIMYLLGTIPE